MTTERVTTEDLTRTVRAGRDNSVLRIRASLSEAANATENSTSNIAEALAARAALPSDIALALARNASSQDFATLCRSLHMSRARFRRVLNHRPDISVSDALSVFDSLSIGRAQKIVGEWRSCASLQTE